MADDSGMTDSRSGSESDWEQNPLDDAVDLDEVIDGVIAAEIVGDATRRAVELSVQTRVFSGPAPDPELLREYEAIVPGSAASLLDVSIRHMEHVQSMQTRRRRSPTEHLGSNGRGSSRRTRPWNARTALCFPPGSHRARWLDLADCHRRTDGRCDSGERGPSCALVTVFIVGRRSPLPVKEPGA